MLESASLRANPFDRPVSEQSDSVHVKKDFDHWKVEKIVDKKGDRYLVR